MEFKRDEHRSNSPDRQGIVLERMDSKEEKKQVDKKVAL